ncbi:MAG: VWA domain-containing protein [Chitinivibrionales bacterium]|nr:VWA domain-containing protein [Chitinivibrionales bacterium]
MRFGSPEYFWLLLGVPLVVGFFIWSYQARRRALRRFAAATLIARLAPSSDLGRQVLRWTVFVLFLVFLVFALVRPRFGVKMEMVERKGVDVIVALDVSKSMLAQDITPNRIERAKHEIRKFIDLLRGDRVGLIVFAGESYVQCPLTLDYGAAQLFLDAVTTDWIQLQGTALSQAIEQSVRAFQSQDRKHKVLVVLSDGEDHGGEAVEAARKAAEDGVRVYTIGIGSESGVPIPLQSRGGGNVVYKKDREGNLVMTRLNPAVLDKIAQEGNGKYFHAGLNLDLTRIYSEIAQMEKKELGMNRMTVYEEKYQWFLAIALGLLLIEFFIPERVRRKGEWKGRYT